MRSIKRLKSKQEKVESPKLKPSASSICSAIGLYKNSLPSTHVSASTSSFQSLQQNRAVIESIDKKAHAALAGFISWCLIYFRHLRRALFASRKNHGCNLGWRRVANFFCHEKFPHSNNSTLLEVRPDLKLHKKICLICLVLTSKQLFFLIKSPLRETLGSLVLVDGITFASVCGD